VASRTVSLTSIRSQVVALVASLAICASACGVSADLGNAQPVAGVAVDSSDTSVESGEGGIHGGDIDEAASATAATAEEVPPALAFVDEPEVVAPSAEFCEASANIWTHSAALNLISKGNPEMNEIALLSVAEWLERSTLFEDEDASRRAAMFTAFVELQRTVGQDFDFDWQAFQTSTAYARDDAAQTFEAERTELGRFITEDCPDLKLSDLRVDAQVRTDELESDFSDAPSTVVESDALPGHSIFTDSSGRLIASFPTAWSYEEARGTALVDLIASPEINRFLANEAVDGVRLQLVEAPTLEDFRSQIDATMIANGCERTNDLTEDGATRFNITQTFVCGEHSASIVGQYRESAETGLIIEASFDGIEASRADLIRLASIANSALWS